MRNTGTKAVCVVSAGQMAPVHVIRSLSGGSRHCRSFPTKQDGIITPVSHNLNKDIINHLGAERLWRFEHVQQFRVVNLQQHACDLPCQVGVHVLNQREETLTWKGQGVGGGNVYYYYRIITICVILQCVCNMKPSITLKLNRRISK